MNSWIEASRPRTLPLSLSGIIVGSACALANNFWNTSVFILALSTTILFQILSNLANDLGDTLKGADNENRVGPKRTVQSGEISVSSMKKAVTLISLLSLISASLLIYQSVQILSFKLILFYLGLAIACILAAITYTIGKKAYGYSGFGDVFVLVFFGIVGVLGVYPLFTNALPFYLIYPALSIGLLSTAVLNLNNLRDHENDVLVGKRTLVVKIGFNNAKKYHYTLIFCAFVLWIFFLIYTQYWFSTASIFPFLVLFRHVNFVKKCNVAKELDSQLKVVALSTFAISFLFFLSVIIEKWMH